MKKRVRIFVAGSKDLKNERYALKALAQELNTRYSEHNVDVFIEMKSFEDFKDRQSEYNSYISEYADLVIIVLDGKIGEFTRSEFLTAVDAYRKKEIPEILVFMKKFDVETTEIKDIKNLLRDSMGEHFFYIDYDNTKDLRAEAEKRITKLVSPTEHAHDTKRWRLATICVAVLSLLLLGGAFLFETCRGDIKNDEKLGFSEEDPMLLFMGGGSVYKFIEEKCGIKIDSIKDYPNSVYMPVSTGNLWGMIAEEFFRDRKEVKKYFPVFLAANRIEHSEIRKKIPPTDSVYDNMLIVELLLGNDTTAVYLKNSPSNSVELNIGNGRKIMCLTPDYVKAEIEKTMFTYGDANKRPKLYTTSEKSGTFKSFKDILQDRIDIQRIFSDSRMEYHENYSMSSSENYVLLGSVYYYPLVFDSNSTAQVEPMSHAPNRMFYVIDDKGKLLLKDMCMYFVAYKVKENTYKIPDRILYLLNDIFKIKDNITKGQALWINITKNNGEFTYSDAQNELMQNNNYVVQFESKL